MKKSIVIFGLLMCVVVCVLVTPLTANASNSTINVVINGKPVTFSEESGYPYVDENNRTMVPLRATMESFGAAVGYDVEKQTAIVITEHNRIEVPINTNILYKDNTKVENDTNAVVNNGRTYLPIRAVLEAAGFTVEWDRKTSTVNAYTFKFNENEFVPYSTSSLETLVTEVLKGNVVYINGQYYATPNFVKMIINTQIHYSGDDLNKVIYPQDSRYYLIDFDSSIFEFDDENYNLDGIVTPKE